MLMAEYFGNSDKNFIWLLSFHDTTVIGGGGVLSLCYIIYTKWKICYLDRFWFLQVYLMKYRGEYSPGFTQFITPYKVHLGAMKHI